MSNTSARIVCTIGPVTNNESAITALIDAGMSVARLNGSHSDLNWHSDTINLLRKVAPKVPILLDIPGRKIRTIQLDVEPIFEVGDIIILTTEPNNDGSNKVSLNSTDLHEKLRVGDIVRADDGTLQFSVAQIDGPDIHCRAETAGQLRSRKGINVPFVELGGELITDRDRVLVKFAQENEVDFIGISFVESAAHVNAIRELTGGDWPRIIAKVENQGGIDHVDEIAEATDAIMIDRGDLSVETNQEQLAIFQKKIIRAATILGKPVIVATEMLHSMIENPFPTKAEISDITNAVLDGCSATMLSGETAIGKFPVQSVKIMRQVIEASNAFVQEELTAAEQGAQTVPKAMEDAIALICRALPVSKIVAVTNSGYAARMVASRRPSQPILAVSPDLVATRSFNLIRGVEGIYVNVTFSKRSTDHIAYCLCELWKMGKINDEDLILVSSVSYPVSGNRMNLIETHVVADLVESLGWHKK